MQCSHFSFPDIEMNGGGRGKKRGDTGPYHTARKCKLLRNNLVVRHACEHHGQSVRQSVTLDIDSVELYEHDRIF